jgi:hypothetical protein
MLTQASICMALLLSVPALPQAVSPVNPGPISNDDSMVTPPPVSDQGLPTEVLAEQRSNYLLGGLEFQTSYISNLYPGNGGTPISERTYTILPTIELDQTLPRRHATINYSPGFTFYQPTSALNEVDENALVTYRVRMTPHSTLNLSDSFQDSSTSFSPASAATGGSVSGTIATIAPGIIAPFAKRLTNSADAEFTLQTSRNAMVGASGNTTILHYPDPAEVPGLFDSSSHVGSGFYDVRLSRWQYLGASYGYSWTSGNLSNLDSVSQTHTITAFYTFYPVQRLSLSVLAGPQHYEVAQTSVARVAGWGPSVSASVGWQGTRTSFAAGFSRAVTAGGGLFGAYNSKSANTAGRWQFARNWTAGATAIYGINKPVPSLLAENQGGHSMSGETMVQHSIGKTFNLQFEYDHIHQSYGGIEAISGNPDSDRVTVSVSWRFLRPLGL